jgi:hypothetical protein
LRLSGGFWDLKQEDVSMHVVKEDGSQGVKQWLFGKGVSGQQHYSLAMDGAMPELLTELSSIVFEKEKKMGEKRK